MEPQIDITTLDEYLAQQPPMLGNRRVPGPAFAGRLVPRGAPPVAAIEPALDPTKHAAVLVHGIESAAALADRLAATLPADRAWPLVECGRYLLMALAAAKVGAGS